MLVDCRSVERTVDLLWLVFSIYSYLRLLCHFFIQDLLPQNTVTASSIHLPAPNLSYGRLYLTSSAYQMIIVSIRY